jgi:hypothetical protein
MGWVVNATPRPLYTLPPSGKSPGTHLTGGGMDSRSGLDGCGEDKITCTHRGSNPNCPARSELLYRLRYPGPHSQCCMLQNNPVFCLNIELLAVVCTWAPASSSAVIHDALYCYHSHTSETLSHFKVFSRIHWTCTPC